MLSNWSEDILCVTRLIQKLPVPRGYLLVKNINEEYQLSLLHTTVTHIK